MKFFILSNDYFPNSLHSFNKFILSSSVKIFFVVSIPIPREKIRKVFKMLPSKTDFFIKTGTSIALTQKGREFYRKIS